MKFEVIAEELVIFEIDGPSHFGYYEVDAAGRPILRASLESYTTHLKKDRWLRKQGWKVFRIGADEVDDLWNMSFFIREVTGKHIPFQGIEW